MTDVVAVLDPELLIPASASANLLFWSRLDGWSTDTRPRIGPKTMADWYDFISTAPSVPGLPDADRWRLIGKFSARGFEVSSSARTTCTHLVSDYSPLLGDPSNAKRLVNDIQEIDGNVAVAIATVSPILSSIPVNGCLTCEGQKVRPAYGVDASYEKAWRDAYSDISTFGELRAGSPMMFPSLTFSPNAWNGVNSLRGAETDVAKQVALHLAVLNDYAVKIWSTETTTQMRQQMLRTLGVEASLESPKLHRNADAMAARTFNIAGNKVVCEWHAKLRPNVNRIYFAVESSRVVVGGIIDHL